VREVLLKENAECLTVLTHGHMDHVGGINHLLELYPDTIIYKHQPSQNQQDIKDNQVFKVDGATLRAVHTPGFVHFDLT
jgi:glyoxylase-like metal-dependent hydrolase (beta-lactamase superfamily II)